MENGPFKFDLKTSRLFRNEFSWNNQANLLYIDQPLGTGFSQTDLPDSDLPTNEDQVSNQMREFLLNFYSRFPEFNGRDLYLAGESFAGHYLPHFGAALLEMDPKIFNLKGVMYGDAYVNPYVQYDTFAEYALSIGLINQEKYPEVKNSLNHCEAMIRRGLFGGVEICLTISLGMVINQKGEYILNIYNVKLLSLGPLMYDFVPLTRFLNRPDVKKSLDVSDRSWVPCSTPGHLSLVKDFVNNTAPLIGKMLDSGIKVVAYNGEWDFVTNWLSGVAWTNSVEWNGKDEFGKAEMKSVGYGMKKSFKNFSFTKIYKAGHMMPMDQPEVALKVLTEFLGQDA
jgi:cathepsin A (carboxypeptidase C)